MVCLLGKGEESSHVPEELVAKWESKAFTAFREGPEQDVRWLYLVSLSFVLELDAYICIGLEKPDNQSPTFIHRLGGIKNEIDENLSQYIRVCINVRQSRLQSQATRDSSSLCLGSEQGQTVRDKCGYGALLRADLYRFEVIPYSG